MPQRPDRRVRPQRPVLGSAGDRGPLVDLLDDDMPAQRALARARTAGIRIFDPTSVVVVAPLDRGINAGATMTGPANDVAIAISRDWPDASVGWKAGHIACLVPGDEGPRAVDVAHRAVCAGGAHPPSPVTGGGPAATGIRGIRRSYAAAVEIVEMLAACPGLPRALAFDDALPYLLLSRDLALAQDVLARLAPLLSRHTLLATVEAFIEAGGNRVHAGERLGVTRRTMQRRLKRIGELTGLAMNGSTDLMPFRLAVCSMRFHQGGDPAWTGGRRSTNDGAPVPQA